MIRDKNILSVSDRPLPEGDWDGDGIPNSKDDEHRVHSPEHVWDYEPKKKFRDTLVGRTLRGKTIVGKVLLLSGVGVLAKFTGIDLTPIIEPVTGGNDMEILGLLGLENVGLVEIGLTVFLFILGVLINSAKGLFQEVLEEVRDLASSIKKAKALDSEDGREVSETERKLVLKEIEDLGTLLYRRLLRNRLLRFLGVVKKTNTN